MVCGGGVQMGYCFSHQYWSLLNTGSLRTHGTLPSLQKEIQSYVVASRKRARTSQRRRRLAQASILTLLVGIILGLVGWINQDYLKAQWHWQWKERPFVAANFWPYALKPEAEQALGPNPNDSFRECASGQAQDYCPEMIVVSPGSFMMGSKPTPRPSDIETPQHRGHDR